MNRPSRTLARLERILTMVPWLLEHPGVHVDEAAERFGVSRDELLVDLDVLGYCGLPGYGGGDLVECTVFGDRITVRMAPFFSRPLHLSLREAVTLLLAARALGGVAGLPESQPLRRAARKLERVLGAVAGDVARLTVELDTAGAEHLPVLRRAVEEQRVVRLTYRSESRGETTVRDVEPWVLTAAQGAWYLQGWCRSVDGPRDFRIDRIREAAVTDEPSTSAAPEPDPPVYRPEPGDPEVVLDLEPRARWVAEWAVVDDVQERDGGLRVRLRTRHLDWAARLVLRLAGAATVVEPPALAARVTDLATRARARYGAG